MYTKYFDIYVLENDKYILNLTELFNLISLLSDVELILLLQLIMYILLFLPLYRKASRTSKCNLRFNC